MSGLKLLALDAEDLAVVSAHVQDSVARIGDLSFAAGKGIFSLAVNRFVWEEAVDAKGGYQRRRALLSFKRVRAVRSTGVDRKAADTVIDLLAIRYLPAGKGPEGSIELLLAGGGIIAMDVECIEAQLADTGGAWETRNRPDHPLT